MIVIKTPKTKEEFKAYYALRYHILREPQGHPKGTEKDDYEPISLHFMAVDDQTNAVVGVVKLFEKEEGVGQFSHLAVDEDHQELKKTLIQTVETRARELGYKTLGTLSHLNDTTFFEKLGYISEGVTSSTLRHVQMMWMEKAL